MASGREYKMDLIMSYTNKIRELHEIVPVRHGVICGQTGSGPCGFTASSAVGVR